MALSYLHYISIAALLSVFQHKADVNVPLWRGLIAPVRKSYLLSGS